MITKLKHSCDNKFQMEKRRYLRGCGRCEICVTSCHPYHLMLGYGQIIQAQTAHHTVWYCVELVLEVSYILTCGISQQDKPTQHGRVSGILGRVWQCDLVRALPTVRVCTRSCTGPITLKGSLRYLQGEPNGYRCAKAVRTCFCAGRLNPCKPFQHKTGSRSAFL